MLIQTFGTQVLLNMTELLHTCATVCVLKILHILLHTDLHLQNQGITLSIFSCALPKRESLLSIFSSLRLGGSFALMLRVADYNNVKSI